MIEYNKIDTVFERDTTGSKKLIDRVAVIEALEFSKTIRHMQANVPLIDEFIGILNDAPTIDAAPVRRGEWKYVNYQIDKTTWITGEFICRKCGKSIPRRMGDNPPDYCQHCGADMRGE